MMTTEPCFAEVPCKAHINYAGIRVNYYCIIPVGASCATICLQEICPGWLNAG